jgi:hypothetical protein
MDIFRINGPLTLVPDQPQEYCRRFLRPAVFGIFLVLLTVFFTACMTLPEGAGSADPDNDRAADTAPAGEPAPKGFTWGPQGALMHMASGAVFEDQYADFVRRDNVVNYDDGARDVSVDYM